LSSKHTLTIPSETPIRRPSVLRFVLSIGALFCGLMAGAYGLSVSGFLLLRALFGEAWGLVGLINSFLHWLLAPSLVLLPAALLATLINRRRRALLLPLVLMQLPAIVTFLLLYGGRFVTRAAAEADGNALTLLTFNVYARNESFAWLPELIRTADADLVLVQELSPQAAALLEAEFAQTYPYRALHPLESRPMGGQGILSRYPIVQDDYWRYTDLLPPDRILGHQRALIDVNGTLIALYNVHPTHPGMIAGRMYDDSVRGAEIERLLARVTAETIPVIFAGDFNMGDQSDDYQAVTAQLTDVYADVGDGMGLTFPNFAREGGTQLSATPLPAPALLRLDYVFVAGFAPLEARVMDGWGQSDHFPLWVRIAIQG
jgi:vancomycin resistance protein VanJ